jgi:hypothetical protein
MSKSHTSKSRTAKSRNAVSMLAIAIVLASLFSSPALARRHGLGGLYLVIGHVAGLLPLGMLHRSHFAVRHGYIRNAALGPEGSSAGLLGNSVARGQIVAAAALAGWHGGRASSGWWRHDDGSYGWVGPLFWPFAYDDIFGYAILGGGNRLWDYGYADIYAAVFAPYSADDLAIYAVDGSSGRGHRRSMPLQALCGDAKGDVVPRVFDRMAQLIQPNEIQHAALDDLASASNQAGEIIQASCPAQAASSAPERLAAMQARIEAMIKAVQVLQVPLVKLYRLLDDEQKARLNARAPDPRNTAANKPQQASSQACQAEASAALQWPIAEIEQKLRPDDTQRGALEVLQDTSVAAGDSLSEACRPDDALTSPERLVAANHRLETWLHAVKLVRAALEDCFATLTDEQKTQFESIGPRRTG